VVIIVCGAALCGWALLSLMGGERHRLLAEQEAKRPKPPSVASAPPASVSARSPSRKQPAADRVNAAGTTGSSKSAAKGAGKNVR
jgi:hypothetical protein